MSSPYRSDVPFVSDDGFPFLVSSARAVVEQKPEIFAGPGHIYVESQFLRRVKIFRIYGHEIEMYTVEQGEKRDKRQ